MDSCSLLAASQQYEHELQILQRQMVGQLTLAKDLNDLELRRARQEELLRTRQEELSRQYLWNECIAAHTLPLPFVSPLPSRLLLTLWVCLSTRLSHERRLMITSDPRSILTTVHAGGQQLGNRCAHGRRQPIPARARAARAQTRRARAGRGSRREHGLGRHAAVDASTRARVARSACSADGSRLRHGRGRREHRRGEHGQHAERNPNRMSNVCVCVYPTAVGRTAVPAREVGIQVARWDSGMAVPM